MYNVNKRKQKKTATCVS